MQDSFEEYVSARGPALSRLALSLTGQQADAADLLQDSLLKVFLRWRHVTNPDAYAKKVLLTTFVSSRRLRRSTEVVDSQLVQQVVDVRGGCPPPADLDSDLRRDLFSLPRTQRAVVVLRYLEDLSDTDIAQLLGIKETTVRVHAHRALHRLRTARTERTEP